MRKRLYWLLCFIHQHDEQLFWQINQEIGFVPASSDDGESEVKLFERIENRIKSFTVKWSERMMEKVLLQGSRIDKTCSTNDKFFN